MRACSLSPWYPASVPASVSATARSVPKAADGGRSRPGQASPRASADRGHIAQSVTTSSETQSQAAALLHLTMEDQFLSRKFADRFEHAESHATGQIMNAVHQA